MRTKVSRRFAQAMVLAAALCPALGHADDLSFTNLTPGETANIVRELSANFAYSSQTPASSLGGLWGFELGLVGGITKAPEILNIVKAKGDSGFDQDKFPHAGALLRVGAPFGLTAEAVILPKISVSDLDLSQYGGAVMWTVTDVFFKTLPVNVAVKGYFNKTKLSFKQQVERTDLPGAKVDGSINFDDSILGGQLLVSKKLSVFEPYLGIGYAKANGELGVTAEGSFQGTIYSNGASSAQSKPSSAQLMAGLDVRLLFISLGAEYQRSFGTDSLSGRLSFRF